MAYAGTLITHDRLNCRHTYLAIFVFFQLSQMVNFPRVFGTILDITQGYPFSSSRSILRA